MDVWKSVKVRRRRIIVLRRVFAPLYLCANLNIPTNPLSMLSVSECWGNQRLNMTIVIGATHTFAILIITTSFTSCNMLS